MVALAQFRRLSRTPAVAIGIALVLGFVAVEAYAATSASAPIVKGTDTLITRSAAVPLGQAGGVETVILNASIPKGSYIVHVSGDLFNSGPADTVSCQMIDDGVSGLAGVDTGLSATVGGSNPTGPTDSAYVPFTIVGGVFNPSRVPTSVSLQCRHDSSNGATPFVEPGVVLWVQKTKSLTVVQEHAISSLAP